MTDYREILRLHSLGISQRSIAAGMRCSRNTVSSVLKEARTMNLSWPLDASVTNDAIESLFHPKAADSEKNEPDWAYVHKEYLKQHVTLKLLWMEYCDQSRSRGDTPLMYSQFCNLYRKHVEKKRAVMHIGRKAGEIIEVDWAGTTFPIIDRDTGEVHDAHIFVSILPYSQYTFAVACASETLEEWIDAHVRMYDYFGGVSRILVSDNLKTGVTSARDSIPTLNPTYQELAEHYGTAIIPARVRKPKDKASVERAVGHVSKAILAALRNQKFFTLRALNEQIMTRIQAMNAKPFHKKEGSRLSVFLGEEKALLTPLPTTSYELAQWKVATVHFNYHIQVDKMHYSVPYEYIKHKVDVRMTKQMIEIFYNQTRIASHTRLRGRAGQYSTTDIHMPEDHQKYMTWNKARFLDWAAKIGAHTETVTRAILESFKVEQQAYRSCMGLLKLGDKYSQARLEAACAKVLSLTLRPSLKSVKNILATNRDKSVSDEPKQPLENEHGFTRGAKYYGGERS